MGVKFKVCLADIAIRSCLALGDCRSLSSCGAGMWNEKLQGGIARELLLGSPRASFRVEW